MGLLNHKFWFWLCQKKIWGGLARSKFQVKTPSHSRVSGRWAVIHFPCKDEGLNEIGHIMIMVLDKRISIFRSQQWLRFRIWFIKQFITKFDRFYYKIRQLFYYKMRKKVITKCVRFCITKCDSSIEKCDGYWKCSDFITVWRYCLHDYSY